MSQLKIDLRSDTLTKPTAPMLEAMMKAEVGDDVWGEDKTVIALEEKVAALLGHEAALFFPSGTMANQAAIMVHTRPGDDVLIGEGSHVLKYEGGAMAALSSVQCTQIGKGGLFSKAEIRGAASPDDVHAARTSLVSFENTHNRGGGLVWPLTQLEECIAQAKSLALQTHLDGARIWNAAAASECHPSAIARGFDSVSACFSKGLGAPIGSALVASKAFIKEARRARKRLGGGMRQVGYLAAAANYALAHNLQRVSEDHAHARTFAETLIQSEQIEVSLASVQSNIVLFSVPSSENASYIQACKEHGLLLSAFGPSLFRAVFHLHISKEDALRAAHIAIAAAGGT